MTVRIAIVGDENPAYPSHQEITAVRSLLGADVDAQWVGTTDPRAADLRGVDGVWLAPGSPYRDDDTAYRVIRWAREQQVPFLGTCGGLQYAVIEYVRDVLALPASHAEVDGPRDDNAVVPLACSLHGQERTVTPVPGTWFERLTGGQPFTGMHYCRYAPEPSLVAHLAANGWRVEATAPDAPVEVLTLGGHPFFVLSLFQPQIGALAGRPPHPLLLAFVEMARQHARIREVGTGGGSGGPRLTTASSAGVPGSVAATPASTTSLTPPAAAPPVTAPTQPSRPAPQVDRGGWLAPPLEPRTYQQQMHRTRGWWRPLVVLAAMLVLLVDLMIWAMAPYMLTHPGSGGSDLTTMTAGTTLSMNLALATGILAVLVASAVYGRGFGRVVSVAGRMRWGWLGRAMLVITPLWIAVLAVSWFVEGSQAGEPHHQLVAMTLITLTTTPLQSAGEELFFRAGLVQAIGAWIRQPWVALAATTAGSASLFALAHGSLHPWVLIDIGSMAVAACWLAWRTGGIEAAIAVHVVNNLCVTLMGIFLGGLESSYVDTDTTGSPVSAGITIGLMLAAVALLDWQAQRAGIAPRGWRAPRLG